MESLKSKFIVNFLHKNLHIISLIQLIASTQQPFLELLTTKAETRPTWGTTKYGSRFWEFKRTRDKYHLDHL